jgi:mono/diheme cytochrome c family protein
VGSWLEGDEILVKKISSFSVCLLAVGLTYPMLFAQTTSSTRDGVYSADQAQRGKTSYGTLCGSCHGDDLAGSGPSPALSGDDFIGNWTGQTVGDLFNKIETTMPATKPGSLTREQTADLVAYILSANKFPAGKADLPIDADSLKKIQFEKPQADAQKPAQ